MKFTPDPTYDGLLSQAYSLASLVRSLQSQVSYLDKISNHSAAKVIEQLEKQLDSEREMNRILTKELLATPTEE